MIKKLLILAIGILVLPTVVFAANITVYPTIETGWGNLHPTNINQSSKDITTCIEVNNARRECQTGVPTYFVPEGASYTILFQPPTGYTYSYDNNCSGVATRDENTNMAVDVTCHVNYTDKPLDPTKLEVQDKGGWLEVLANGPFSNPTPDPMVTTTPVIQTIVAPPTPAPITFSPAITGPLTQAQAESLINIVQTSPGTPASAFTNLITAFSSISVVQADSLISVIQAAPGVPASAFVNLLISFTTPVLG